MSPCAGEPNGPADVLVTKVIASGAVAPGRDVPPTVPPPAAVFVTKASPEVEALTVVQTMVAPTITVQGQDRHPTVQERSLVIGRW